MEGSLKYALNLFSGVFRRSDGIERFLDISSVKELHSHELKNDCLRVGANVSLSELMAILTESSKTDGFEYATELVKHIDLVAHVHVRNVSNV